MSGEQHTGVSLVITTASGLGLFVNSPEPRRASRDNLTGIREY